MKTIVTQYSFSDSFRACERESQFSSRALRALFEHLERVEEDTDTELELDPVALCCEWAEYPSAIEAANDCGFRGNELDTEEFALEWLHEQTQVVEFDGGIVIQQF